jgi:hypothetical protein
LILTDSVTVAVGAVSCEPFALACFAILVARIRDCLSELAAINNVGTIAPIGKVSFFLVKSGIAAEKAGGGLWHRIDCLRKPTAPSCPDWQQAAG